MLCSMYHGTRLQRGIGELIGPVSMRGLDAPEIADIGLTTNLDESIWDAELAPGDAPPHIYIVEPLGEVDEIPAHQRPIGRPSMSLRTRAPLRVIGEVTEWAHYHGTRAQLRVGDLIKPGHAANFGDAARTANHVYFARTLDAATWGAELAQGDGPGRIYIVAPTGPYEGDPNLTDKKFRGNPTKSFRSRSPIRVIGEVTGWKGHSPEIVRGMKDALARRAEQGGATIDD